MARRRDHPPMRTPSASTASLALLKAVKPNILAESNQFSVTSAETDGTQTKDREEWCDLLYDFGLIRTLHDYPRGVPCLGYTL